MPDQRTHSREWGKILKKKDRENGLFLYLYFDFFEIVLTVVYEKRRIYFEKYRNRYSDLSRIDALFQWKDKSNGNIPFYGNSYHVGYRRH